MTEMYKCSVCGNTVTKIINGGGTLVCCGKPMDKQEIKTGAEGQEKHKPVIEATTSGIKVKVGSIPHPMVNEHYIVMINVLKDGKVIAGKRLYPGELPEAEFNIKLEKGITATAYCNVHGLWSSN